MSLDDKRLDLAERIQAAIAGSGESLYAIARRAGVSYPALHRFVAGKRSITLETAAQLATALGLELVDLPAKKSATTSGIMPKPIRDLAARLLHGAYEGAVDQLVAGAFSGRQPTEAELDSLEKMVAELRAARKMAERKPGSKGKS